MKIMPTLEGGLRMDIEDAGDWAVLLAIARDAIAHDEKLSQRLGNLITHEELAEDWREFVVPELEAVFNTDLAKVVEALHDAESDGSGHLWITPDDAWHWYSSLNQARLALHEIYHFDSANPPPHSDTEPGVRSAFLRSQFYCALQSFLLDHVMK